MKKNMLWVMTFIIASVVTLTGCASGTQETKPSQNDTGMKQEDTQTDHSGMNMDQSSSASGMEGLTVAENPTYKVGSKVVITEGHMEGMKGAEATVVGAYDTVAYAISYNPKNGGERVTNHKWVIQEEISEAGTEPLKPGAEVTINAAHMAGMDGVTATVDSAEKTTVYMVNFTPTTGGEEVTNHKWVIESELSPSKT